MSEVRRSAYLK
ncbi:hypothetical protein F383_30720 [Gossypium arboreum]|uniref:Uncharacterized protein n=1 Tax=Gossypium arboreum TaxID=29729 RepID=A0A0B0PGM5_GOSAR|nr:hypothetical protein F383_30720 [Gossypium arboreum]